MQLSGAPVAQEVVVVVVEECRAGDGCGVKDLRSMP